MSQEPLRLVSHEAIDAIGSADWDRLAADTPPFLRHAFLAALEQSGAVSEATGWRPRHLTLASASGELRGVMPLYEKNHSWGEFVFDWAWADAYHRAGLAYYPKWVAASPFTPATAPKLLATDEADRVALLTGARELAEVNGVGSVHWHFLDAGSLPLCRSAGLLLRKDCQFHWRNAGYEDFDEFLGTFSSAKRKKVRRERRRVREAGLTFTGLTGNAITETDWHDAWQLTRTTFRQRGHEPYLPFEFFLLACDALPEAFHVIFANDGPRRVAASIFFASDDCLYGRYWGASANYHSLHFETCYYQGIDHCIDRRLERFEPGTQGEHKISRGFEPTGTWSAHWLADTRFASALDDYLARERRHIDAYIDETGAHTPYRRPDV